MVKILTVIFFITSMAGVCQADYELRLDGGTLIWREYFIERDEYCTRKELGKFCIQKSDVLSLKEIKDEAAPALSRRE